MWIDFLKLNAERFPQRTALVINETGARLAYADLDTRADRWATLLDREGLVKGDRLAFLAQSCLEHITLFFACARLGVIFVPLNVRLGERELEEQLARLAPALLITRDQRMLRCDAPKQTLDQIELPESTRYDPAAIAMEDTLLMLFTSGSTGVPKGVMLHAGMLLWNILNTTLEWGLRGDDVSVVHMPFFHTGGYNVTLLPLLYLGGRLIMTQRFEPGEMLALIEREHVSFFFAVPTMYLMMREHERFESTDFSAVRASLSGGAPCAKSLIEAWRDRGVPLKQGFGLTEVGPNCFAMTDAEARDRPDSIGRPMRHSQMRLVDEDGVDVAPGEIGELAIKGPHVTRGYWRMESAFAKVFRDGWFHTGDLMRCDEEGFYYVAGRRKDMYISGGENVYPGEVLRQLVQHPGIIEAVVIPVPDHKWGEVGFVFYRGDAHLDLDELREFLDGRLSRYKHPHYLRRLTRFPLLANNKTDVAGLKRRALEEIDRG